LGPRRSNPSKSGETSGKRWPIVLTSTSRASLPSNLKKHWEGRKPIEPYTNETRGKGSQISGSVWGGMTGGKAARPASPRKEKQTEETPMKGEEDFICRLGKPPPMKKEVFNVLKVDGGTT